MTLLPCTSAIRSCRMSGSTSGLRLALRSEFRDELIERTAKAVDLEPTRAYWRARLAWSLAHQADYREATVQAYRALELQPTSALAWQTLLYVSDQTDDDQLHRDAMDAVCRLELKACDPAFGRD